MKQPNNPATQGQQGAEFWGEASFEQLQWTKRALDPGEVFRAYM